MNDPFNSNEPHMRHGHRTPEEIAADEARGLGPVPSKRNAVSDDLKQAPKGAAGRGEAHPSSAPSGAKRRPQSS